MKKLLLIPALMVGTLSMATDYNYEVTPVVGYNITEGNLDIENHILMGLEAQLNVDSLLKPELSGLYSNTELYNSDSSSNIYRIALNGVYEYEKLGFLTPLAKIGMGYETMSTKLSGNEDSVFGDIGLGAKIPFSDNIALKLETVYMLKNNVHRWDNNLALLAGLNFAFGEKAQAESIPVVIDGDDDKDGVNNSIDRCPNSKAGENVDAYGCKIDGDDDNDGVKNSIDRCPNSKAGENVDNYGCKIDGDDDNDGVKNSIDRCPNSPVGAKVNGDGCPIIVNLHINFENDSIVVEKYSFVNVDKFANFLIMYPEYSAKITGYTDDKGSVQYNQILSEKRANAVKLLLVQKGIDAKRILTQGKGETNFVASNKTKQERAQNRRIEAELTKN